MEYELNADGVSYSVIGIGTCTDTELVIPNAYNSLPVTAIASNTFECVGPEDAYWLKSVVVGNNVKTIGAYAFDRSSIQKVVLPEGLTTIEDGAFYEARELEEINIPNSVTYIADNAFNYCTSLKSITISDVTVDVGLYGLVYLNEEIPSNTYNVDTSFSCIIIGSEVKKILSNTFHECYATDTLIIAKGVETIESLAFNWMDISNVIFLGTVEEWNAIEKGANWMAPEGSTWTGHVQCTDGQV